MDRDEHGAAEPGTLRRLLRDGPLPVGEALGVSAAVADEVAALHAAGRAHGHLDADGVLIDADERVSLAGPSPAWSDRPAPPEVREADLHALGRLVAATLGLPVDGGRLPDPVERLVRRSLATGAPASALALALRRLQQDPVAAAAALGVPQAVAVRPSGPDRLLATVVPPSARRTTGTAAAVLVGAAAVGVALLLLGAPGSTAGTASDVGQAAAAPAPAASTDAPVVEPSAVVPDPDPDVRALLSEARKPAAGPAVARAVPAPSPAASAPASPVPTPTPSRVATAAPPMPATPTPSAPAPSAPSAPAPSAPAPTAPPATTPTAPIPEPEPTSSASAPATSRSPGPTASPAA